MIKSSNVSYAETRRVAAGITINQNTVRYRKPNGEEKEGKILDSDGHDNLRILYLDPEGIQCTYQTSKGVTRIYYRTRFKNPQNSAKYKTPKDAPALPFLPPLIIEKAKAGAKIHTLLITEGEVKALVATLRGFDCIGIPGIHQFKIKKARKFHPFIQEILLRCEVQEIVFLVDGDCLNLTSDDSKLTPERMVEKDLSSRPKGFCSAIEAFGEAAKGANINAYFGFIKPENGQKGLDDLLVNLSSEEAEIIADLHRLTHAEGYFSIFSLNKSSYFKIWEMFGVTDVNCFYEVHGPKIGVNEFKFKGSIYRYDAKSGKPTLSENNFIQFWAVEEESGNVQIDLVNYLDFLHDKGFRLYRLSVNDFLYVRIQNNVIQVISSKDIKDFVVQFVNGLSVLSDVLKHKITHAILLYSALFSEDKLNSLKVIPNRFHTDQADRMYFYFRNGFVEVTQGEISLKQYSELTDCIWENQILPHDYSAPELSKLSEFMFTKFVNNICSIRQANQWAHSPARFDAFTSTLGYALHQKKQERKAILFTDTDISDAPEGRTGKTIIGKALGKLRVYTEIDGKNFDPDDRFKYQRAQVDTQVLHINDAGRGKKAFDFELMFTSITEGVVVEKKNQASFTIYPTILISSNRAVEINGGSARARVAEFEFANYYSDKYSPKDEFGVWFFDDWAEKDWNLFYFFMFNCARKFLADGLVKAEPVNLDERKLRQATSKEFLEFSKDNFTDGKPYTKGNSFLKSALLIQFKTEYPEYDKMTPQKFSKWLESYGKYKGWQLSEDKKVNGERFYSFK